MSAFTRMGKQILANGYHYADASDERAAEFILEALNAADAYERLHKAASDYFRAASDRTSRHAAPALAAELRKHPSKQRDAA